MTAPASFGACRHVDGKTCLGHWPKGGNWAEGRAACPRRQDCSHWQWDVGRDQQRAAREKRTVPLPRPPEGVKHWCRWCTAEIKLGRVKQRGWHDGREDEPNCAYEFRLHSRREDQFAFVKARDGLECWDCKTSPERWRRDSYETGICGAWVDRRDPRIEWVGRYQGVEYVTALELEHETPIWKVAHLPDDERRPFFGPQNLRLRCPGCHKAKTAREAAERASAKRAA